MHTPPSPPTHTLCFACSQGLINSKIPSWGSFISREWSVTSWMEFCLLENTTNQWRFSSAGSLSHYNKQATLVLSRDEPSLCFSLMPRWSALNLHLLRGRMQTKGHEMFWKKHFFESRIHVCLSSCHLLRVKAKTITCKGNWLKLLVVVV